MHLTVSEWEFILAVAGTALAALGFYAAIVANIRAKRLDKRFEEYSSSIYRRGRRPRNGPEIVRDKKRRK